MDALGIDTGGHRTARGRAERSRRMSKQLRARPSRDDRMKIRANCAARTVVADITPIVEITQRTGLPIECCTFIGSSPIRQCAEGWSIDYLRTCTERAVSFAVKEGLQVMCVTEDDASRPGDNCDCSIRPLIQAGASGCASPTP